jgi:hypothetical protein
MAELKERVVGSYRVELMEYEAGWGSRIDERKYFDNIDEAVSYIEQFNSTNTEKNGAGLVYDSTRPLFG